MATDIHTEHTAGRAIVEVMPKIVLQERDVRILAGLYESRIMTLRHAAALYFDGREEAAKKRLQAMRHAGYIAARRDRPGTTQVYFLSRPSFDLLAERRLLPEHSTVRTHGFAKRTRVSPATIGHELDVMTVKSCLEPAIRQRYGESAVEFLTWPRLFAFRASRPTIDGGITRHRIAWIKPDGFLRVTPRDGGERADQAFYLELDRGTETLQTLASKAVAYREHHQDIVFARRQGRDQIPTGPRTFRVLMVFQTNERRNNAAEAILSVTAPIRTLTWLTTLAELTADPLGPIWITPKDYLAATAGTEFAPIAHWHGDGYRRRPARESHVESKILKHNLFDLR